MCGVLEDLVSLLGDCSPRLVTYAGGASCLKDLDRVRVLNVFFREVFRAFRKYLFSPKFPFFKFRNIWCLFRTLFFVGVCCY